MKTDYEKYQDMENFIKKFIKILKKEKLDLINEIREKYDNFNVPLKIEMDKLVKLINCYDFKIISLRSIDNKVVIKMYNTDYEGRDISTYLNFNRKYLPYEEETDEIIKELISRMFNDLLEDEKERLSNRMSNYKKNISNYEKEIKLQKTKYDRCISKNIFINDILFKNK